MPSIPGTSRDGTTRFPMPTSPNFFLVWLKRTLPGHPLLHDPFDRANALSPKEREAIQDETRKVNGQPKNREWFENAIARAFAEGCRVLSEDGIGSVVFAHESTEGWKPLLSGMVRGGWTITGSRPIATETEAASQARDSTTPATSLHLVCRPRSEDASIGDWARVQRELPRRLAEWMQRLKVEGVRGADLIFASLGPALEIFSRHSRVETAEGRGVGLSEYLEKFREAAGREGLRRQGDK